MRKILLFLFLLLIPTQLGWHWWPEWSKVWGVRIDYLSPTLYLVDMVWGMLLILNLKFIISSQLFNFKFLIKYKYFWLGLGVVIANLLVAGNVGVAAYKWLRIGQAIITIIIIKRQKPEVKRMLEIIIPIWIVAEVGLGLAQVINGGSIQGIFYWLGERNININWPGVAVWSFWGNETLRAYGTFSHPNSMAGFLLVSILVWWQIKNFKKKALGYWLFLWLGVAGLAITGSRVIWAILIIFNLKFIISNEWKKRLGTGLVIIGLGLIWWANREILGGWDSQSWSKRWDLSIIALKMWRDSPILGVGLNNFLVKLPEYGGKWWQPVHNIPLLWLSELGMVGIGLLIFNLKFIISNQFLKKQIFKRGWWKILLVVLVTGLIDHYWWTLPQNWWLWTVIWGLLV